MTPVPTTPAATPLATAPSGVVRGRAIERSPTPARIRQTAPRGTGAQPADGAPSPLLSRLDPPKVLGVDRTLPRGVTPQREARALLPPLERVEVVDVVVEHFERQLAGERRPMAGDDALGALDERSEPGERGAVRSERSPRRKYWDLDVGEIVAGQQHADVRREDGHAVGRVAVRGLQLELLAPEPEPSGKGELLDRAEAQGRLPHHVVPLVRVAQLA